MDYYQGSVPLSFIPFGLENQMAEKAEVSTSPRVIESEKTVVADDNSGKTVTSDSVPAPPLLPNLSPHSQDSEPNVTAYAESVVKKIEQAGRANQLTAELPARDVPDQDRSLPGLMVTDPTQDSTLSSTLLPDPGCGNTIANLSGLEAVLDVATSSSSLLPELRLASHLVPQPH